MSIENGYKVKTRFDQVMIWQCVKSISCGVEKEISQTVVKLQDQGIRDALIAAGWTPPKD